jgi:hypothetical protein
MRRAGTIVPMVAGDGKAQAMPSLEGYIGAASCGLG